MSSTQFRYVLSRSKFGLLLCRQCFRERAAQIGFEKVRSHILQDLGVRLIHALQTFFPIQLHPSFVFDVILYHRSDRPFPNDSTTKLVAQWNTRAGVWIRDDNVDRNDDMRICIGN